MNSSLSVLFDIVSIILVLALVIMYILAAHVWSGTPPSYWKWVGLIVALLAGASALTAGILTLMGKRKCDIDLDAKPKSE